MPYSPPPYTAVDFDGAATAYIPPSYTAVDFNDTEVVAPTYLPWIMFMASVPQ